ncbi:hypothetical protein K504DRAFT_271352 [Pleomassaria siparia CBS 279.74]|uniref:Uncharacterized protein n=1 Tax=Pleomassaria siparia CBS 279.74 TaxID=1314801 RepID=A0A6G1K8S2_9PLEO|nr:hypothetical protein K504DRAFT_271352 [Pleomassaria siparia CBS 279.74]
MEGGMDNRTAWNGTGTARLVRRERSHYRFRKLFFLLALLLSYYYYLCVCLCVFPWSPSLLCLQPPGYHFMSRHVVDIVLSCETGYRLRALWNVTVYVIRALWNITVLCNSSPHWKKSGVGVVGWAYVSISGPHLVHRSVSQSVRQAGLLIACSVYLWTTYL